MRVFVVLGIAIGLLAIGSVSDADRSLKISSTQRNPIRMYVGATAQQYDTLAVDDGERVELQTFTIFADDSAMTPTLHVHFVSKVSKTVYLRLVDGPYTANQVKSTHWTGPWVFPKDSTILVYYNLAGTTPGTLDTLRSVATWKLERP